MKTQHQNNPHSELQASLPKNKLATILVKSSSNQITEKVTNIFVAAEITTFTQVLVTFTVSGEDMRLCVQHLRDSKVKTVSALEGL